MPTSKKAIHKKKATKKKVTKNKVIKKKPLRKKEVFMNDKPGRVKFEITPAHRRKIVSLGKIGTTIHGIASGLGIAYKTLRRRVQEDKSLADLLDQAVHDTHSFVESKLMKHIKSDNIPCTIFYLKTRAGWSEKIQIEGEVKNYVVIVPAQLGIKAWQQQVLKSMKNLSSGSPKKVLKNSSSAVRQQESSSVVLEAEAKATA